MAPPDLRNDKVIEESTFTVLFLLPYEAQSSRQNFHFLQKVLTSPPNLKVEEKFWGKKLNSSELNPKKKSDVEHCSPKFFAFPSYFVAKDRFLSCTWPIPGGKPPKRGTQG